MAVNAGVPQGCVLSPLLFLLHINAMLEDSNIHCYADGSTVDAVYFGCSCSRENAEQCRNKLVSSVVTALENVSSWGEIYKGKTWFNLTLWRHKLARLLQKVPFIVSPIVFQNTPLQLRPVSAYWAWMFRVTASIPIIWKARPSWPRKNWRSSTERDGTSHQNPDWLYIGPRFGLIWSIILITGLAHPIISLIHLIAYNVKSFESLGTLWPVKGFLYRIYHGECSEELFDLLPAAECSTQYVTS